MSDQPNFRDVNDKAPLKLTRADLSLGAAAFVLVISAGALFLYLPALDHTVIAFALGVAAAFIAFSKPGQYLRWAHHELANRLFVARPVPIMRPWVLDGDTIEDRANHIRYRLANIDAPETGDNARCANERRIGERAHWEAVRLVRNAQLVQARVTWRIDRFGRRVAFVLVDGEDLGELLMRRGLARYWRGRRENGAGDAASWRSSPVFAASPSIAGPAPGP